MIGRRAVLMGAAAALVPAPGALGGSAAIVEPLVIRPEVSLAVSQMAQWQLDLLIYGRCLVRTFIDEAGVVRVERLDPFPS